MEWPRQSLINLVNIRHPIVQAPMAGGPTTPALVAAVSNAGGLGSIGGAYLTPDALRTAMRETRALTDRPFAVNLFIPETLPEPGAHLPQMVERLARYHAELNLPAATIPNAPTEAFAAQVEVMLEEGVPVFSFTFGVAEPDLISACHAIGAKVIGTATTVAEARLLEERGVDAIAAQGAEAGGHRGTFNHAHSEALVGTIALVPQIASAVSIPVIAMGGIMDGRGIAAALALGADGAGLGTAFLVAEEAGTNAPYRRAVLDAEETETQITTAFSGKPARGIRNRFMVEVGADPATIPPYPWQNALTKALRAGAAKADAPEYLSLWAGQGVGLTRELPASVLMETLVRETQEVLSGLSAHV